MIGLPSYLARLLELHRAGIIQPGSLSSVEVRHDNACGLWRVGVCDCTPDLRVIAEKAPGAMPNTARGA
jgi:hypothetical protein